MTDMQLYLAIGLPVIAILVSTLVNVVQFSSMNGRMSNLENRVDTRMNGLEARFDVRFASLEAKFDMLTGKVIELDNRFTRLEERLSH